MRMLQTMQTFVAINLLSIPMTLGSEVLFTTGQIGAGRNEKTCQKDILLLASRF